MLLLFSVWLSASSSSSFGLPSVDKRNAAQLQQCDWSTHFNGFYRFMYVLSLKVCSDLLGCVMEHINHRLWIFNAGETSGTGRDKAEVPLRCLIYASERLYASRSIQTHKQAALYLYASTTITMSIFKRNTYGSLQRAPQTLTERWYTPTSSCSLLNRSRVIIS